MDLLQRTSFIYRVTRATLVESVLHASESTLIALQRSRSLLDLPFFVNNLSVIAAVSLRLFTDDVDWWMVYGLLQSVLLIFILIRLRAVAFVVFVFYLQFQNTSFIVPCMNALLIYTHKLGTCAQRNMTVMSILLCISSRAWVATEIVFLTLACETVIIINYMIIGWKNKNFMMESNAPFLVNTFAFILGIRANSVERFVDANEYHPNNRKNIPSLLQGVWWTTNGEGFTLIESTGTEGDDYEVPLSTSGTRAFPPTFSGVIRCLLNSLHPTIVLTFNYLSEDDRVNLQQSKFLTLPLPIRFFSSSPPALLMQATRDSPLPKDSYVFVSSNILRRRILRYLFLQNF